MSQFLADFISDDAKCIVERVGFSEIKGKSVLITGASGLVGHYLAAAFNLAARLGQRPSKVFLVTKNPLPDYFKFLTESLPVTLLQGDLTEDLFLQGLPEVDFIIHGAGYGQPKKFMFDAVKTLKINTYSTFRLLEKLNPSGKFLFISSSEIYSGLAHPPYREDQVGLTNTNHPRSCYIEGKRSGEAIVNAYRSRGIVAKSVRLSLAYGPGTKADDDRVLSNFIKRAVLEKQISLMDQGAAHRTYMYITDAAEFILDVLFRGKSDIYNVGGTSHTTIAELAKEVGKTLNVPVSFPESTGGGLAGAPDDVFLDMSKASVEFGPRESVDLTQGLKRTIEWQKALYTTL
jgi:UDP-glucuronate decarboxylase